ncbi:MAG: heme-binding domain-containing protein [Acidobacteria bacterium]|nr:heme-binding domain-containing protein [Acidobacteriota bacterium]
MFSRLFSRTALAVVIVAGAAQMYRPAQVNPAVDPAQAIDAGGNVPADVMATFKRSCYNCHSNTTVWPWYGKVAPVSWGVADDVSEGRSKVNFSAWGTYPGRTKVRKLEDICDEVKTGGMPLTIYRFIHPDARLSESDVSAVCGWTAGETARIEQEARLATMPAFAPWVSRGGLVFVSGISAADPAAAVDVTGQANDVLDELSRRLASAGSSLDRVVSTSVYLTQAEDFAAMNAVWAARWPKAPPTRTTVVVGLPRPGARIQVSAIAAAGTTTRDILLPAGWPASTSPYSYAIRAGDTVLLSGLVPRRGVDNTTVQGDITVQTRAVLENAKAILAAAGLRVADVVSSRVFVTDVANFEAMNAAYRAYFPTAPPARATVKAALTNKDYLVEITLTAVKGGTRTALVTPNADGTPGKPNPNLSSAVVVGPRMFLSGMLGMVPGSAGDAAAQTNETLNRLDRTLNAGGFSWPAVVDSTVYVTDVSAAPAALDAMKARLGGQLPVGTLVVAGLVAPEGRVEIMLTAAKPER